MSGKGVLDDSPGCSENLVNEINVIPEDQFLADMEGSFKHKFAKKPEVIDGNMKALKNTLEKVNKIQ